MLANSVFPLSMWGELFILAAYFKNRTPHKALKMETPFKTLHDGKIDFSHLSVVGSKPLCTSRTPESSTSRPEKGWSAAVARRENLTEFKTQRLTASLRARTSPLMKTPPHLLPPPLNLSPLQDLIPPSCDLDDDALDNNYISYDELLRNIRDYNGVLDFTIGIPSDHKNASGVSVDPQVHGLVDQIQDLRFSDARCTFSWSRITSGTFAQSSRGTFVRGVSPPIKGGASPEPGKLSPALCQLQQEGGSLYARAGLLGPSASRGEGLNDWGGRGYDDFVPGEVTKTAPSGDKTT